MKIAIITCYDQVDHTRALVIRNGFASAPGVEPVIIKNKHKGLLRYVEVPLRILGARIKHRPDAYVITFRGYEMLPLVLLIKGRKPLVFDEMVNAIAYVHEHKMLPAGSLPDKLFAALYGWLARRCQFVLADTDEHAKLSAELSKADPKKYITVPVGTDESLFYPAKVTPAKKKGFTVFYYGVMTKLHGLKYFLDAAVVLSKKYPDITFVTGGDKEKSSDLYKAAIKKGARITHRNWFPFEEIPGYMHEADVVVGGPFGDSPQSQFVITTKTFQALACKRPVLVGRNKVNADFRDRVNSLVVPQGDAKAIVDAITWAYEHPKDLDSIAAKGRALYEKHFSQTVVHDKIAAITSKL